MLSSFVLLFIIATLFYKSEYRLYFDLAKSKMQNEAFKISSSIINSHMNGGVFDKEKVLENSKYKISFYDYEKRKVFGNIDEKIDFSFDLMFKNEKITLIDKSSLGHLGIYYVVLQEHNFEKSIEKLLKKISLSFSIIYALIVLLALFLGRMFLKPIQNERIKLNNFIKDTTHELNTPITAILMSTGSENISKKSVERINISARRVSEIYKDMTYLFLEDNQNKLCEKELALKDVLEEQLIYFEALASKKRVVIKKSLGESFFKIDKESFVRLVNNLLSNAIKYNKIGGEIEIVLDKNSLIIQDKGIGIKKKELKDIFKRFHRANDYEGGFGIGLNIVSEICKKYNIKIDVSSRENEGSCFRLSFR